jgi:trimethylamine--corrinoid protein Co-methyltransferase
LPECHRPGDHSLLFGRRQAPITVSGALVLQHAKPLAGITLAQLARPGAPVAYGGFLSNVDMKSGSPAFGTPEHIRANLGSGQLARHIGLPCRSSVGAACNAPDAQGATETVNGLWAAMLAQATVTLHAAGWLEGRERGAEVIALSPYDPTGARMRL